MIAFVFSVQKHTGVFGSEHDAGIEREECVYYNDSIEGKLEAQHMNYEIIGDTMPVVICHMNAGESIVCTAGAMAWMDPAMEMNTESESAGKMFGRMFSGDNMMRTHYTAREGGKITLAANFPGKILPVELHGETIICQKGAFLASDETVDMDIFMQKKIAGGLFSGEGFVLQKFSGYGTVLIAVQGAAAAYDLKEGQSMIVSGGHFVMMDETCDLDVEMISGAKNVLFGSQGFAVINIKGPGRIVVQTMPSEKFADVISSNMPSSISIPSIPSSSSSGS